MKLNLKKTISDKLILGPLQSTEITKDYKLTLNDLISNIWYLNELTASRLQLNRLIMDP